MKSRSDNVILQKILIINNMKKEIEDLRNIEIEGLRNIEIKVQGKNLSIFNRFPNFIPFVGDEYENKRILLIWESYYITEKSAPEILKNTNRWYFEASDDETIRFIGSKPHDYQHYWNFASKMHEKGISRNTSTFQNVEKVLNKFFSEDTNSFKYCAGYNYYLRLASHSSSIKSDKLDDEVARETLKEIINILKPKTVIFFSKKASKSFSKCKNPYKEEGIKFKAFVHPACAWWNTKYGKEPKKSGRERFEDFIKEEFKD